VDLERFAREHRAVVLKAVNAAARRFRATEADIEDAVSEVFLELLKDDARVLKGFRGESALTTWLTVVAHRIAIREFSKRRPPPVPPRPERRSDPGILAELEKLPERERRALVMFHIEERSYREIAAELGVPLNQVGMILLRAREALAKLFRS
jgi:RNA polymerase sigma-70 factor (ECF subfamily)